MLIDLTVKVFTHFTFQEELDLTASKKEVMFNLPSEKKWQLYLSKKMVKFALNLFQNS